MLLWRPPPRYQGSVQGGDRGPLVDWLRSNLPGFKETRPVEGGVFDAAMVEAVIRFQLANGLKPDGIVGPHTLICLDTLIGTGSPLLVVRQEVGP